MEDRVVAAEDTFTESVAAEVSARGRRLSARLVTGLARAELARVFELRQSVYRGHSEYLLRPRAGRQLSEDELDDRSHHFACEVGGAFVAACRFTPCPAGRWEGHDHVALPDELASDAASLAQVGRVVVHEGFRAHRFAEALIWFACQHLALRTALQGYFALCLPPLVRYYRHFGATLVAGPDVVMPGRASNRYRFIRGNLSDTAATTRRFLEATSDGIDSPGESRSASEVRWELPVPTTHRSVVETARGAACETS